MTKITELSQLDLNGTYSYADYLTWRLEETVELIKGKIMAMSPAPSLKHQSVITNLGGSLYQYFHKRPYKLFYTPFDVKLYNSKKSKLTDQEVSSVVQPDLCVICDKEKLTEQGCNGAPDWIIEVLSPGTATKKCALNTTFTRKTASPSTGWFIPTNKRSISFCWIRTPKNTNYLPCMLVTTSQNPIFFLSWTLIWPMFLPNNTELLK